MTKSQNTKKDLCIISEQLTKQLKKGELLEGFYYINDGAKIITDYYHCNYWEKCFGWDIQQVFAPVPTFDELQNMNKAVNECMAANIKLVEENAQLKELLKECRLAIFDYPPYDLASDKIRLTNKIDEVLK